MTSRATWNAQLSLLELTQFIFAANTHVTVLTAGSSKRKISFVGLLNKFNRFNLFQSAEIVSGFEFVYQAA